MILGHSGARHPISGLPEIGVNMPKSAKADLGGANPESMSPAVVMDSGLAASRRPGMTPASCVPAQNFTCGA